MKTGNDSTTAEKKNAIKDLFTPLLNYGNVKLKDIHVREGFNARTDFGDLTELKKSIAENGLRVPLKVVIEDGKFYLVNGERRYRALQLLHDEKIQVDIPVVVEKEMTEEQKQLDLILTNNGKPLTPVEEGEVYFRLTQEPFNLKVSDISKKVSQSAVWINKLLKLHKAPDAIKDSVRKGEISASAAAAVIADAKDDEKAIQVVSELVEAQKELNAKAPGKKKKHVSIADTAKKKKGSTPKEIATRAKEAVGEFAITGKKPEFSSFYVTELLNHILTGKPKLISDIKQK